MKRFLTVLFVLAGVAAMCADDTIFLPKEVWNVAVPLCGRFKTVRFDAAFKEVHPCIGYNKCGMNGACVFQDDFEFVRKHILDAGMVVLATPMYYFGISSQIKAVIDRFYVINGSIHVPKRAALLMTYANTAAMDVKPIISHYEVLLNYLGWSDAGRVIASGVWPVGAVNNTKFPEQAYRLGRSV